MELEDEVGKRLMIFPTSGSLVSLSDVNYDYVWDGVWQTQ